MPIHQLSPAVVNKIAAGEVIERPASVVKELLENAVDAGANRIDVTIEKGGGERVRVTDNGCGIAVDEMPLAVASHATSKIQSADDLFSVTTLGFRGEALASIAAVSRLLIRSRQSGAVEGAELEVVGGAVQPVAPTGCPTGTTIEVRNLFFNTPVRQKFLRSAQTELGHATEAFTRIALARPEIHLTLTSGGRLMHDLPPADDIRRRIAAFFGADLADNLIEVQSESEGVGLKGYVANPTHSRSHNRMQYLFLNGRAIRDRALQHALCEAYRGLLLVGRQPICFLRLEMPAELVDVNVHPTKQEVRFQDAGRLYSQLLGTLRTKFLTTDLTARAKPPARRDDLAASESESGPSQLVAWAKEQLGQRAVASSSGSPSSLPTDFPAARQPLSLHRLDRPAPQVAVTTGRSPHTPSAGGLDFAGQFPHPTEEQSGWKASPAPPSFPAAATSKALQVHDRYIVLETDTGFEVIDQHALHERILYEQIREKVTSNSLESQKLLVPEPVDLSASEAALVLEHASLLARLGLEVQPFGGETVLVSSYPAMLANLSPAEVLRDVVELLLVDGKQPEPRDLLDDLLHSIACKAAVKFGDRLTSEEVCSLVEARHLVRDQHHCPHGRPTALVFTREELDRQFKRI